jgi:hypothetical protein
MVSSLVTIARKAPPTDREESILDRALHVLDARHSARGLGTPVLADLLQVIREAPADVRQVAIDHGSDDRYRELTENLEASLAGMTHGGRFGGIFTNQTTAPIRRDRPVVFDVSSIDDGQMDLQAAVLLASWSAGFGAINVSNYLADACLEPRRHYLVLESRLVSVCMIRSGSAQSSASTTDTVTETPASAAMASIASHACAARSRTPVR